MTRGRETTLTPQLQNKIISYLEVGATIKVACNACDLHYTTYFRWVGLARRVLECRDGDTCTHHDLNEGKKDCKNQSLYKNYIEFYYCQKKARDIMEINCLKIINEMAMEKNFNAAAWALERMRPERYARVSKIIDKRQEEKINDINVNVKVND